MTKPLATPEADDARWRDPAVGSYVRTELVTLAIAAVAMFAITAYFLSWRDAVGMLGHVPLPIAAGFAAMILTVLVTRKRIASRVEDSPWLLRPWNVFLFLLGASAACACNWLLSDARDPHSYFVKPFVALVTFGVIPALVIGRLAVWLYRRST